MAAFGTLKEVRSWSGREPASIAWAKELRPERFQSIKWLPLNLQWPLTGQFISKYANSWTGEEIARFRAGWATVDANDLIVGTISRPKRNELCTLVFPGVQRGVAVKKMLPMLRKYGKNVDDMVLPPLPVFPSKNRGVVRVEGETDEQWNYRVTRKHCKNVGGKDRVHPAGCACNKCKKAHGEKRVCRPDCGCPKCKKARGEHGAACKCADCSAKKARGGKCKPDCRCPTCKKARGEKKACKPDCRCNKSTKARGDPEKDCEPDCDRLTNHRIRPWPRRHSESVPWPRRPDNVPERQGHLSAPGRWISQQPGAGEHRPSSCSIGTGRHFTSSARATRCFCC